MGRPKSYITKTALADVLGLSKARVSQLVERGLPVRADGKVNRDGAVRWYEENIRERMVKPGPKPKPATDPVPFTPRYAAEEPSEVLFDGMAVYEGFRQRLHRVPEILLAVHPSIPPVVLLLVVQGLDDLLGAFAMEMDCNLIADGQEPAAEPDYRALIRSRVGPFTQKQWRRWESEKDAAIDKLMQVLWPNDCPAEDSTA